MITDIFTNKQIQVIDTMKQEDWSILVLHGAKRSGKTHANNLAFLMELRRIKEMANRQGVLEPKYILAGVSSKTIENNILSELYNTYGVEVKHDKHGSFTFMGVKIVQAYTGNIGGVASIRGMTAYGAYINEASLSNPKVFQEIRTRCSGNGARLICDANPADPEHWLKKDYIDNETKEIRSIHFAMEDNTFLSERYISSMKETTPTGMFYDRDILGLWVSGDGVVYKDFDANRHYVSSGDLPPISTYYCGVDWGYEHFGSIVVVGETDEGTAFVVEEHTTKHEEIEYWVEVAQDIQGRYGVDIPFYCDTARPEHIARFVREGIEAYNANKARLSGIEAVSRRFKENSLFVCEDKVKQFKKEIYQYIWGKNGDALKENDDMLDALRYAIYSHKLNKETDAFYEHELNGVELTDLLGI